MNSDDIFKEYALKVLAGKPGYSLERAEELFPNKAWLVRQYYLIYMSADVSTINQNLLKYINAVDARYNDLFIRVQAIDEELINVMSLRSRLKWDPYYRFKRKEIELTNQWCAEMIDFLNDVKELDDTGTFIYSDELQRYLSSKEIPIGRSGIDSAINTYNKLIKLNLEELKIYNG